MPTDEYDFVIVGGGPGGGPLAANLARNGFTVALLDAGGDPGVCGDPSAPNPNYEVPAFHAQATQDKTFRWDYYVQHYKAPDRQSPQFDSKYVEGHGILYPRASGLGGCAAHNALITVYPHNEDWENLRTVTGDASWSPDNMRSYFQRLEQCRYVPPEPNRGGHGFGGWLPTSVADPAVILQRPDSELFNILFAATAETLLDDLSAKFAGRPFVDVVHALDAWLTPLLDMGQSLLNPGANLTRLLTASSRALADLRIYAQTFNNLLNNLLNAVGGPLTQGTINFAGPLIKDSVQVLLNNLGIKDLFVALRQHLDPNDWRVSTANLEGVFAVPLATDGVRRYSPRELVQSTSKDKPDKLTLFTHCLVTRVLFEGKRAVGVEYARGPNLYRVAPEPAAGELPAPQQIRARHDVVLAAGAFNTPQILMLSGIGPREHLEALGITVVQELPGVGGNLQDRYEIGVISEMIEDFALLPPECDFQSPAGPCYAEWQKGKGVYTTNGVVLSVIKRSSQAETAAPDLFLFGIPGFFKGYYPNYANYLEKKRNCFTWAILKGHTRNTDGSVRLKSTEPRDMPMINFNYFDEGSPGFERDRDALVEAIEFVRRLMARTGKCVKTELLPNLTLETPKDIGNFILREAWGHHACGTCKIGTNDDPQAVLDGRFRVRGVEGLRVVDASVFPRIPGFFIVTSIYMISEKASDVIAEDARSASR